MRWIGLLALVGCGGDKADSDATRMGMETPGGPWLELLASDNGLQRVMRIGPDKQVVWSVEVPSQPREMWRLNSGEVLVSVGSGAVWLSLEDGTETRAIGGYSGVQSAVPIPGGVRLAAQEGQDVVLIEVDDGGSETSRINLGAYPDLRLMRVNAAGNALFTTTAPDFRIVEVAMDGTEVHAIPLPGKGYVADPTPEGTVLATTGGDARLVELAQDGTILRDWGGKSAHPEIGLDWASGYAVFPDGSAVFSNWLGHGMWGTAPHLFWFDEDNDEILWSWEDHEAALQITNLVVLDHQRD